MPHDSILAHKKQTFTPFPSPHKSRERERERERVMILLLVEVVWSLVYLIVHYYKVLRKETSLMALQYSSSSSSSSPLPWKRFAESPSLISPKRQKETTYVAKDSISMDAVSPSMETNVEVGEGMRALRKEKRRPARIEIPKSCVGLEFGEVGKKEGLVEEGYEVGGSEHWLASRKGTRHAMEDGYGVVTNINGDSKQAFFGVFDGHGGRAAMDFVSEKLGKNVVAALGELQQEDDSLEVAMRAGYLATDTQFLSQGVRSGACAASVLLRDGELVAANVGDCRVVASKKGIAQALTSDHRAGREDERIRIEKSGGYVNCHNGVWRVQDSLAVSRAIGDGSMKRWVISEPETTRLHLTPDCEFLILASDGLWDKVSNQEAVDSVLRHEKSIKCCKVLVDLAASRGSRDDITVMVVDLQSFFGGVR